METLPSLSGLRLHSGPSAEMPTDALVSWTDVTTRSDNLVAIFDEGLVADEDTTPWRDEDKTRMRQELQTLLAEIKPTIGEGEAERTQPDNEREQSLEVLNLLLLKLGHNLPRAAELIQMMLDVGLVDALLPIVQREGDTQEAYELRVKAAFILDPIGASNLASQVYLWRLSDYTPSIVPFLAEMLMTEYRAPKKWSTTSRRAMNLLWCMVNPDYTHEKLQNLPGAAAYLQNVQGQDAATAPIKNNATILAATPGVVEFLITIGEDDKTQNVQNRGGMLMQKNTWNVLEWMALYAAGVDQMIQHRCIQRVINVYIQRTRSLGTRGSILRTLTNLMKLASTDERIAEAMQEHLGDLLAHCANLFDDPLREDGRRRREALWRLMVAAYEYQGRLNEQLRDALVLPPAWFAALHNIVTRGTSFYAETLQLLSNVLRGKPVEGPQEAGALDVRYGNPNEQVWARVNEALGNPATSTSKLLASRIATAYMGLPNAMPVTDELRMCVMRVCEHYGTVESFLDENWCLSLVNAYVELVRNDTAVPSVYLPAICLLAGHGRIWEHLAESVRPLGSPTDDAATTNWAPIIRCMHEDDVLVKASTKGARASGEAAMMLILRIIKVYGVLLDTDPAAPGRDEETLRETQNYYRPIWEEIEKRFGNDYYYGKAINGGLEQVKQLLYLPSEKNPEEQKTAAKRNVEALEAELEEAKRQRQADEEGQAGPP